MAAHQRLVLTARVLAIALAALSAFPLVFAQDALPEAADFNLPFQTSPDQTIDTVNIMIAEGIKYVGIVSILVVAYGGILMITSYGDDGKAKTARTVITYALVGVMTAIGAYFLVNIVNNIRI